MYRSGKMTLPRIGLTGSFGRGNYGDELYVKTYEHWFGGWADLHLLTGLPRQNYLLGFGKSRVDLMDAVVLGGGDLLCPYRKNIDRDFIHPFYLRRPLHVAGIGVERNKPDIDPEVLEKWKAFLRHKNVRSITMRDPESKAWVEEHIAPRVPVGVTPDLVCALPLPAVSKQNGASILGMLKRPSRKEQPILGLVTRHIKHPKEYRVMADVARHLSEQGWKVRHVIGGVGGHGAKDFENAKTLEVAGKETFYTQDLDAISQALGECSLVLSMKLHTTIVASMYGVPTISMNPVVKARNFMRSMGREDCVFAADDRAVFDLIAKGVPAAEPARIARARADASAYMMRLGQTIWDDFRQANGRRRQELPASPAFPAVK